MKPARIETVWFCGECMNASEFRIRAVVPKAGACECCGRSDNGKVWELGGITVRPRMPEEIATLLLNLASEHEHRENSPPPFPAPSHFLPQSDRLMLREAASLILALQSTCFQKADE